MLGYLVLDEAEDRRGGAHGQRDPEKIEVLLIAWIVDTRNRLRDTVPLLRELRDHEIVLVVTRHGEHDVGRSVDPRALEDVHLRRVTVQCDRPELLLERLEAIATLLDQGHLVPHREERRGDIRADLSPACDDEIHQVCTDPEGCSGGTRHARTSSTRNEIAVCVGQRCEGPRFA